MVYYHPMVVNIYFQASFNLKVSLNLTKITYNNVAESLKLSLEREEAGDLNGLVLE